MAKKTTKIEEVKVEEQVTEANVPVVVEEKKPLWKKILPSKEDSTKTKALKVTGIVGAVSGIAYAGYKLTKTIFCGSSDAADEEFPMEEDFEGDILDIDGAVTDAEESTETETSETEENTEA